MDFNRLVKIAHRTISILTLASTVLLLLCFMFSFDIVNGYFLGGILPILFNIAFILGIAASFATALILSKDKIVKTDNIIGKYSKSYIGIAIALAVCALGLNILVINKYFTASVVGACFFVLFILSCATKSGYKYSHAKLILLLLSILLPMAMHLGNNTVLYRHSNSVENTLTSVFAIAFLIYVLYEGNRLFTGTHSRWHFSSMALVAHTGITLSVSYIIAYMTFNANEKLRFYQMILILLASIFAEVELFRFVKTAKAHTQAEWDEIEAPETEDETGNEEKADELLSDKEKTNEEKTDE